MPHPLTVMVLAAPSLMLLVQTTRASVPAPSTQSFTIESIDIQSDRYHSDNLGRTVVAEGNVVIVLKGSSSLGPVNATIAAGTLRLDSVNQTLDAERGVSATFDGGSATGQSLRYELPPQRLTVIGFATQAYGLSFNGGSLIYSPNRMALKDASFTTCPGERPDYEVYAHSIEIRPGKSVVTRGVVIRLFGRRALTLPNLSYRVQEGKVTGRTVLPLARPSWSRRSGLGVDQPVPLRLGLDGEVGYATRAGIRGTLAWEPEASGLYALAEWKQEQPVPERTPALVSRVPEIGYRTGRDNEWRVSSGYYVEHGPNIRGGRVEATYSREWKPAGATGWRLGANARAAAYTSGDTYATANVEAVYRDGSEDRYWEAGLRPWAIVGKTPFTWDEAPSRLQVLAATRHPLGSYRVSTSVVYDIQNHYFHDVRVSVGRRYRCLEPEIAYSSRRASLLVNLRVHGLTARSLTNEQGPTLD